MFIYEKKMLMVKCEYNMDIYVFDIYDMFQKWMIYVLVYFKFVLNC